MKNETYYATILLALIVIATARTETGPLPESLRIIEDQYVAAINLHVEGTHQSKLADLNAKYIAALEKALQTASKGDRLEEALALKAEMKRVREKEPLPQKDEGAHPVLLKFRMTYREQLAKLMADRAKAATPIVKKFDEALAAHQSSLTKEGKVEEAATVKSYRDGGLSMKLLGESSAPVKPEDLSKDPRRLSKIKSVDDFFAWLKTTEWKSTTGNILRFTAIDSMELTAPNGTISKYLTTISEVGVVSWTWSNREREVFTVNSDLKSAFLQGSGLAKRIDSE